MLSKFNDLGGEPVQQRGLIAALRCRVQLRIWEAPQDRPLTDQRALGNAATALDPGDNLLAEGLLLVASHYLASLALTIFTFTC
jgi:hypothetical protein